MLIMANKDLQSLSGTKLEYGQYLENILSFNDVTSSIIPRML